MKKWGLKRVESQLLNASPPAKKVLCLLCLAYLFLFGLFRVPALASIEAESLFAQGSQQYLAENYSEARDLLSQAAILEPQHAAIHQALGLCYLALKDYQEAYQAFRTALYLNPYIKSGWLYLGISQYFMGQYQQAQAALIKARAQDPEDGLARYYLGLCALQLDQPQEASKELSQGYRLSPEMAANFKPYENLALIPNDVRPKRFRLSLLAGLEYDSNAALQTERDLQPWCQRKKGHHVDWAGRLGSRFEYYPCLQPNYNLGFRLNTFFNQHTWLDNWNWFNGRADLFLNVKAGPILLQPLVGYDHTFYGGEQFSTFYIYGLTIDWPETNWLRGELSYRALDRVFHYGIGDRNNYREGWEHQVGFYQGILLHNIGVIRLGVVFERDLAEGAYMASRTVRGVLNSFIFLPWDLSCWASLEYARNDFDNYNYIVRQEREDDFYQAQILLKKPLRPDLAVWLGYGYNTQRSNTDAYQYDRHLFTILLSWDLF